MKRISVVLIAALLLTLCPVALCEGDGASTEGDFFDQARDWWNAFSSEASQVGDELSGLLDEGIQMTRDILSESMEWAESYLNENYPGWNEEVRQAWETLKQAAEEGTEEAREKALEAYETLSQWMQDAGVNLDEGARAVINAMGEAAGIAQAAVNEGISRMEAYFEAHGDEITQEIEEAWNTIRLAATEAGSVAQDALDEARGKLQDWLEKQKSDDAGAAEQALEELLDRMDAAE